MRQVKEAINRRFGPFFSIGCYRPGNDGEHPLGRACDFMLSTGGIMPTAASVRRGYNIAAWAQANASRLGIMYIIYRQRTWDIRMASSGWVPHNRLRQHHRQSLQPRAHISLLGD